MSYIQTRLTARKGDSLLDCCEYPEALEKYKEAIALAVANNICSLDFKRKALIAEACTLNAFVRVFIADKKYDKAIGKYDEAIARLQDALIICDKRKKKLGVSNKFDEDDARIARNEIEEHFAKCSRVLLKRLCYDEKYKAAADIAHKIIRVANSNNFDATQYQNHLEKIEFKLKMENKND